MWCVVGATPPGSFGGLGGVVRVFLRVDALVVLYYIYLIIYLFIYLRYVRARSVLP